MDGFQLGPLRIYWYSLCLLAAVWVGYAIALHQTGRAKLSQVALTDLVVLALVAGVAGGRFGYVVQNLNYFSTHWIEIFYVSSGGLSIHGALIGSAIAVYWYGRRRALHFLDLTDRLVLPLLAGQIIGRLGNYFNHELYGYPTNVPWKIFIPLENRISPFMGESHYHPTFLYEMMLNAVGLAILWRWRPQKTGQKTGGYLIVFAVSRFIVEIWRISDRSFWQLSTAQMVSIVMLIVGLPLALGATDNIFKKLNNSLANLRENGDRGRNKKN
jgi:phosphatidylglycerol:prolipoprotein diacylglycerol transferase